MWLLALLVLGVIGFVVYRIVSEKTDSAFEQNPVVHKVEESIKSALDVNKDGKVDVADVKEAATKAKAGAKKAAGKAKAAAKKVKAKVAK
jgi:hypothetical protein